MMMKKLLLDFCSPVTKSNKQVTVLKTLLLIVLLYIGSGMTYGQVAANYIFSESTGNTYTPITGGTVLTTTFTNPIPTSVAFGGADTFKFNNVSYSSLYVSDNGFVTFGAATFAANQFTPLSNPDIAGLAGVIAGYGCNIHNVAPVGTLVIGANYQVTTIGTTNYTLIGGVNTVGTIFTATGTGTGTGTVTLVQAEVRYEKITVGSDQVFVVQYKDVARRNGISNTNGFMNFQIRLNLTTNVIEVLFKENYSSTIVSQTIGQVGLRSSLADYNGRQNPGAIWVSTAPVNNTTAMTINNASQGLKLSNTINYIAGTSLVWTPCYNPTALTFTINGDNSSADFNFTPPIHPTASYDYEVRTSGAAGSGAVGLFASGNITSAALPFTVPGLLIGSSYTLYVKSNCKVWASSISAGPVVPACNVATIPYSQDFEGIIAPAIPNCNSTVVVAGAAMITQNNTITPYFGFNTKNLKTNSAVAQNNWYFTQVINFPVAGSYKLKYTYGGSRELPTFEQQMKVAYGSIASVAGMTNVLIDHTSIKNSPVTNTINFTVAAAGNYYIGFNAHAIATQGYLQIDDILVDVTTCFPPTALTAPVPLVASTTALITWTAPVSGTPSGYQYYIATVASGLSPTNLTAPTGSVGGVLANLIGLTSSTAYNFWVRSDCGFGDFSAWSSVGTFTTIAPYVPSCVPSDFGFSRDPSGITNVTMGSINNTTGLEPNGYGDYSGFITNVAQGATVPVSITYKTGFSYFTAIWVDWNKDGIFQDPGEKVTPLVDLASASTNPAVFLTSFMVPIGQTLGSYRLRIGGIDDPTSFGVFPLIPCRTEDFQAFEDYSIFVIVAPPALTTSSSTQTICSGTSTSPVVTVTSPHGNFQVYSWSPSDGTVSGTLAGGYTFTPLVTTTYILTASQTSGNFSTNTATFTVNVNPIPTAVAITPVSLTMCQSATAAQAVPLTVSGGVINGVAVPPVLPNGDVNEDFNNATTSYTFTNTSTGGGNPAAAAWTPRPSPFNYVSLSIPSRTFISNDNSQFYQSSSDLQENGPSPLTNTELISPLFDIPNTYTSATLSFWHQYTGWGTGVAEVQISTNSGGTYTTLPGASWSTAATTQGTSTSFVKVSLDLTSYIANAGATLKIKFKYSNASWAWFWSIDNISVSGSATSTVTWTSSTGVPPNTGLFTDLIGTPYTGVPTSSLVYAKPNTTTTFTATASTLAPVCPTTQTILVTVTPLVAGAASSNQSLCFGLPSALFVTSATPVGSATPVRWEYATDLLFTVPIAIAASASSTLSVAKMTTPALTAPRFFRAVFTNGVCTAYSNVVTIDFKTTTWDGSSWSNGVPDATKGAIFTGNYSSTGDLTACSVRINSNVTVTFNNCNNITGIADPAFLSSAGHTLTVENTVAVSTVAPIGNLIFQNHASLMQGLTNTTNGNTGAITYNRRTQLITKFDYTYWSSPVANQVLSTVSPQTLPGLYYYFDPVFYTWTGISNLTAMQPGQGYIIRGPQSWTTSQIWTAPFNGVPNNGDITPIISGGNSVVYTSPTQKANCLGNPYPSALNADLFMAGNPEFSGGTTMYFWTHNNLQVGGQYVAADYATYNYTGPTGVGMASPGSNNRAPNGRIATGQGFIIRANSTGTVTFTNAMRNITPTVNNISNNNFYRTTNQEAPLTALVRNRIWLDLRNEESAFKQLMVGYIENATNGYDNGYDGDILEGGNPISFYSVLDASKLTIQGRALPFNDTDQIPLGYKCDVATNYEIAISQFDGLFTDTSVGIYLDDTLLNVTHNLRESSYSFVTEAGTFDTRFVLRYTTALSVNQNTVAENQVLVYKQNNDIRIQSTNSNLKSVQIYDTIGRLILDKQNINSESAVFENIAVAKEVLLVQVTRQDGTVVTKKVIF